MTASSTPAPCDTRALRSALGNFATGITVITARGADGRRVGLTANSFNSVSLDPPLIVWSLARSNGSLAVFEGCSHYAVNVLSAGQEALSNRFAMSGDDKFAGVAFSDGLGGAPLLDGCCAWFECANSVRHPGGDHLVFIGEVQRFAQSPVALAPLIYHGGRYRQLAD